MVNDKKDWTEKKVQQKKVSLLEEKKEEGKAVCKRLKERTELYL